MPWNPFRDRDDARARFERLRHGRPMDTRESSTARGYGSKWQRYREHFLASHPLCRQCAQYRRTEPATVVDHVVPVKGSRDPMFWHHENHQALCHACHNAKTAADKRAGKTRGGSEGIGNGDGVFTAKSAKSAEMDQPRVRNPRGRPRKGATDGS